MSAFVERMRYAIMVRMTETQGTPERDDRRRGFLGIGLAVAFALAAFASGVTVGAGVGSAGGQQAGLLSFLFASNATPEATADMSEFWQVWNLLNEKFVAASSTEPVSAEDRVFGAIQGLVGSYGDPYTVFFPPVDAQQFEEDISGNFEGVGMEVGLRDDVITVIAPLPDTPAEHAGILSGDVIVKIDDNETNDMTVDEAVKLIRGEKGTTVTLTLYRDGEQGLLTIPVVRDTIDIPTIDAERIGDVYVIRLYSFNALAETKMREELAKFGKSGATKLILDLRGNPGGYLESAVAIGGYFIPQGKVIVREQYGDGKPEDVYRSRGNLIGNFTPDTMVVLVNEGSASAAEILAGALKEHGVATLIGDTTFGKGSVQELVDLPHDSSLKVTIARWLTPEGISFSGVGLEPTIHITRTPQQVIDGQDPQQDAALEWLRGNHRIGEKQ
jgi:carboxyl-terminal processing protease